MAWGVDADLGTQNSQLWSRAQGQGVYNALVGTYPPANFKLAQPWGRLSSTDTVEFANGTRRLYSAVPYVYTSPNWTAVSRPAGRGIGPCVERQAGAAGVQLCPAMLAVFVCCVCPAFTQAPTHEVHWDERGQRRYAPGGARLHTSHPSTLTSTHARTRATHFPQANSGEAYGPELEFNGVGNYLTITADIFA